MEKEDMPLPHQNQDLGRTPSFRQTGEVVIHSFVQYADRFFVVWPRNPLIPLKQRSRKAKQRCRLADKIKTLQK